MLVIGSLNVTTGSPTLRATISNTGDPAHRAPGHERTPIMCMRNCVLFEIQTNEPLGPQGLERRLMQEIVQKLQKRGVKCTRIKGGFECLFSHCMIGRSVVTLGILAAKRISSSSVQCSIHCVNRIPLWKRLFRHASARALCSGEALNHICGELTSILDSDPQVKSVEWLTREEWMQKRK
jgi:hypothetical protein